MFKRQLFCLQCTMFALPIQGQNVKKEPGDEKNGTKNGMQQYMPAWVTPVVCSLLGSKSGNAQPNQGAHWSEGVFMWRNNCHTPPCVLYLLKEPSLTVWGRAVRERRWLNGGQAP